MALPRIHRALAVIALAAATLPPAAASQDVAGRWLGGVRVEDDYAAVALHLVRQGDGLEARLAYPNQRRVVAFDRVRLESGLLRLERADGSEVWEARIGGAAMEGTFRDAEESGRFELLRAAEAPLAAFEGVYAFPDGNRMRVARLRRVTDEILAYFDSASGEDRWLFPAGADSFFAGPTFEQPVPVERRAAFARGADGAVTGVWWSRGGQPVFARRTPYDARPETLDALVSGFLDERSVPGAAVAVVHGNAVVYARGFGLADAERAVPVTLTTRFQIGSITKVFTASLLMALREAGVVSLDDPVSRHLPPGTPMPVGPPGSAPAVTLRHLVLHTSGLAGDPPNRRDSLGVMVPYDVDDLYAGLAAAHLRTPAGRSWSYSNFGYGLLGHALERAAGTPYEELLRARILAPLGMDDTRIRPSPEDEALLAVHYWPEDEIRVPRPRWRFGEVAAFGGLASTLPDMARFVSFHVSRDEAPDRPLSEAALREMQAPQHVLDGWDEAMGYGWMIRRWPAAGMRVLHGGEVDGHSSYVAFSPTHRVGVVALANLGGSTANDLGERVLTHALAAAREQGVPTRDEAFERFLDRDWVDAAWALDTVARARPDDGVAWFRLGTSLYELRRLDEARAAFERAAGLDFVPEAAMVRVARIYALRGDAAAAWSWLERARDAGFRAFAAQRDLADFAALRDDPRWEALAGDP